jgi:hypothetical protein
MAPTHAILCLGLRVCQSPGFQKLTGPHIWPISMLALTIATGTAMVIAFTTDMNASC